MSTTEAVLEIVKTVGPAITGVGGALATLWRTTHSIFKRLSALEKEVGSYRDRHKAALVRLANIDDRITDTDRRFRSIEAGIDELSAGMVKLAAELAKSATDIASLRSSLLSYVTQSGYAKQLERMASLERRVSELDVSVTQQDATLINFAREQNEQWQGINRSLGQLEGFIKGRESIHDG